MNKVIFWSKGFWIVTFKQLLKRFVKEGNEKSPKWYAKLVSKSDQGLTESGSTWKYLEGGKFIEAGSNDVIFESLSGKDYFFMKIFELLIS